MRNRSMHGHGPRRASARSTGRIVAVLLVTLCTLMMGMHVALAEVQWEQKGGTAGYQAKVAPYEYTTDGRAGATAEFLGFNWDSMSQTVKSSILNDENGNNAFRNLMENHCWNTVYDLETGANPIADAAGDLWARIFGNDKVWRLSCSTSLYEDAKDVVNKWLFPSEGTSGGGNVDTDQYILIPVEEIQEATYEIEYVAVNLSTYEALEQYAEQNDCNLVVRSGYWRGNPNNLFSNILACKNDEIEIKEVNGVMSTYWPKSVSRMTAGDYGQVTVIDGHKCMKIDTNIGWASLTAGTYDYMSPVYYTNMDASGEGTTGEPYIPTPDPTPTAPSITIGDVTIDLSNGPVTYNNVTYSVVYAPDNSWSVSVETHTDNQYGGNVTATDPTDYTSILNAILAAINAFRQEVNGFNNQINANITTAINSINTSLHSIDTSLGNKILNVKDQLHTDIQTLQSNIQDTIKKRWDSFSDDLWNNMAALDGDIIDELDAVARYIVDGINFDGGMDDDEIVKWLKKIYLKNNGKVTTPAPDDDPKGWLDRLTEILNALLDAILSGLNVAQLATLFEGLKARFPISIPWDIAAIVNMFAGGAVTPVFDLPLPNGTNGAYTTIHVDLHEWDEEMALVRQGELVLFGIVLMYNTKWMFDTVTMTFRRGE